MSKIAGRNAFQKLDTVIARETPQGDHLITRKRTYTPPAMAAVPDLTGLSTSQASIVLALSELKTGTVTGTGSKVIGQTPSTGALVPGESSVDYWT